jgi:glycosyltransferase involved in cell wall biosynthesis
MKSSALPLLLFFGPRRLTALMNRISSRILFVSYTADWTGPTNSLLLLLKYLRNNYDVAVVLPGQGLFSEALAQEQIPYFSLPGLTKWQIPAIIRLIRRERFDMVYANNTSGGSRNALIAAKITGTPSVCHVRGMGWDKSWKQWGFLWLADTVLAVSEACAASVERFVRSNRLQVIYNGVTLPTEQSTCDYERNCIRYELGLPLETKIILSIAHICPRKGQLYAIAALAEVIKAIPTVHLCLVGSLDRDRAYVDQIRRTTHEHQLEDFVTILGFRSDIFQLMGGADVFMHTAIADPHPRAVIEAMAFGLPVVAFAVDGVAETVVEEAGFLVPTGDVRGIAEAVQWLLKSHTRAVEMGKRGRERVQTHFTATRTAVQVKQIISELLQERR